jgi:lipid-A-disaccharide synthase
MVVFYRVTQATWVLGKMLTDVPFFSMVNLLAGRRIVPELIQQGCTADKLASEAKRLLENDQERQLMCRELSVIAEILSGDQPAAERAAEVICKKLSWTGDRNIQPVAVS